MLQDTCMTVNNNDLNIDNVLIFTLSSIVSLEMRLRPRVDMHMIDVVFKSQNNISYFECPFTLAYPSGLRC